MPATDRRLSLKVRRAAWVETEHPRDREGKFIETFAQVRIWGGGLAKVLRYLGAGRFEVERDDNHEHVNVHRNYLTVVSRPDGSAPSDRIDSNPAPVAPADPTPDAVDLPPLPHDPANDAVPHGDNLADLIRRKNPALADLVTSAATDYMTALDNGTPDDEAEERAGLLGVLDTVDRDFPNNAKIRDLTKTLRETSTADPAAPETVPTPEERFDSAVVEARAAGDAMSAGVLEVARDNYTAGDHASATRLVGLTADRPARSALLAALGDGNAKPGYNEGGGGGPNGTDGSDGAGPLEDVAPEGVRGDPGSGPSGLLPGPGGRRSPADSGPGGLPDGAPDAGGDVPGHAGEAGGGREPGPATDLPGGPADPAGAGGDGAGQHGPTDRGEPATGDGGLPGRADGPGARELVGRHGDWAAHRGQGIDRTGGRDYLIVYDADGNRVGSLSRSNGRAPYIGMLDSGEGHNVRGATPEAAMRLMESEHVRTADQALSDAQDSAEIDAADAHAEEAAAERLRALNQDLYGSDHTPTDADLAAEANTAPEGETVRLGDVNSGDVLLYDGERRTVESAHEVTSTGDDWSPRVVFTDGTVATDWSYTRVATHREAAHAEDAAASDAADAADLDASDAQATADAAERLRALNQDLYGSDTTPTDEDLAAEAGPSQPPIITAPDGTPVDVASDLAALDVALPDDGEAAARLTDANGGVEPDDGIDLATWDNITLKSGTVHTTNRGDLDGLLTSRGTGFPVDVYDQNGNLETSIPAFQITGVTLAPEALPSEAEIARATDEDAPELPEGEDLDGEEIQPTADLSLNLAAIGGSRFTPPSDDNMAPAGTMAKLDANIAALQTLRELQNSGADATPEEQVTLSKWAGWGGLPGVFDFDKHEYDSRREFLLTLLNAKEWNEARRNTLNAHYTDPRVVAQVWEAAKGLGLDGGRVLEPGSGSGTFIGLAPENVDMIGVELDSTTAALSKYLYPHAQIRNESFADTEIPDGAFDAAVGNVPFGNMKLLDRDHNPGRVEAIHNHFILKSLALTRPGGIVAVLSSRWTLDGPDNERARRKMYEQADLIGAVRLPNGSHNRASGTDVIEDVLIFRKRPDGVEPDGDTSWLTATQTDLGEVGGEQVTLPVSDYFRAHPDLVLGKLGARSGQYGPEVAVTGDVNMPGLPLALSTVVASGHDRDLIGTPRPEGYVLPDILRADTGRYEGNISVNEDGEFTQAHRGAAVPFDVPASQRDEVSALIGLQENVSALLNAEHATGEDTAEIATLRDTLNAKYDAYLHKYGPINRYKFTKSGARQRPAGPRLFRKDPLATTVAALESYDPTGDGSWPKGYKGSIQKASIFTTRAVAPRQIATTADNPVDALTLSMDTYGKVNLPAIAKMLGEDEYEARATLGEHVFEVPPLDDAQMVAAEKAAAALAQSDEATPLADLGLVEDGFGAQSGTLVPAQEYLSGNVRKKLAHAQLAAVHDPRYLPNVEALRAVIPTDLGPDEIDGRLGAAWIDAATVKQFVQETLGMAEWERRTSNKVRVSTSGGGIWIVEAPRDSNLANEQWGIDKRGGRFGELVQSLLEQREIKITKPNPDWYKGSEGIPRRIQDVDATLAANEKAEAIQERFSEWLWEDRVRARKLAARYNDQFNGIALRSYDGSGRAFVGLSDDWRRKVQPHVKNAVERIVNEPTALLAHVVGAGKTAEMVMGSQELKRLGLARKPAIVVPNHMLEQFTREYLEIYPGGKLLAAGTKDLNGDARREFVAKAAVGDWDAIILTQGAFEAIPMSKREQRAYIDRETARMRSQLESAKSAEGQDSSQKRTIKKMENAILRYEEALKAKLDKPDKRGGGVSFEQTGIDYLMVDEAHMYSNLMTVTNIQSAGATGSNKATDLHMKMEYLRATTKSGRVATFATGTPIRNTVTQAYIMQRFLRPDLLDEAGLHSFDQWAATFGSIVSEMELKPEGSGYRQNSRFAKFRNVPELLRMFHTFADVKLAEDLNLKTPDLAGGKAQTVTVPRSEAQAEYIAELGDRAGEVRSGGVSPEEDNMLKISTDGRKAALSMRLVGGHHEPGKIEAAAERIGAIYQQNKDNVYGDDPEPGAMQIVFLDMGTPKGAGLTAAEREALGESGTNVNDLTSVGDWNAYDTLKAQLTASVEDGGQGIPAEKVRYIHEAKNDAEKAELFAAAKNGQIAVLVGSSEKMGVGTNIQKRAIALHHLDAPWRPADVEQREGRIYRQGNLNPEVQIIRYVTEGTFDTYMWQTLTRKAKFINQVMRGSLDVREIEDVGDTAMNYAEVMALSSGNPDLLEFAKAETRLTKLQRLERTHNRTQTNLRDEVGYLQSRRDLYAEKAGRLRDALTRRTFVRGEAHQVTVGGQTYMVGGKDTEREAAGAALTAAMKRLRGYERYKYRVDSPQALGTLGGFTIMGQENPGYDTDRTVTLSLDGLDGWGISYNPADEDEGLPNNFITRAENALANLEYDAEWTLARDAEAQTELERVQSRIGLPFTGAAELAALTAKVQRLAEKMKRDEARKERKEGDEEIPFDPRIDTDQYDDPLVRTPSAATDAPPEELPPLITISAGSLAVDNRIEFVIEGTGGTEHGTITSINEVGDYMMVSIRGDDGEIYTRAIRKDGDVTRVAPQVKARLHLGVLDGQVVVEVKRNLFREWEHPRDSHGRFIEIGSEVRIWGGGLGKVVRTLGGGRIEVERSTDHVHVNVDAGNLTVTKTPAGESVNVGRQTMDQHAGFEVPNNLTFEHRATDANGDYAVVRGLPETEHAGYASVPSPLGAVGASATTRSPGQRYHVRQHEDGKFHVHKDPGRAGRSGSGPQAVHDYGDGADVVKPADSEPDALRSLSRSELRRRPVLSTDESISNRGDRPAAGMRGMTDEELGQVQGRFNGDPRLHERDTEQQRRHAAATGKAPEGTTPAPDAKPEDATARFRGLNGEIAWLESEPHNPDEEGSGGPVGYLQSDPNDPSTTVRYDDPNKWADDVDAAGMQHVRDTPAPPTQGDAAGVADMSDADLQDAWAAQNLEAANNPVDAPFTPYQQAINDEHYRRQAEASQAASPDGARQSGNLPGGLVSRLADLLAKRNEKGKPDATGDSPEDPIDVNGDLDKAAQLLSEGKHIRLNRIDEAGTLLDKLGEIARDMEAKGEKAPAVDLCLVSVPGTNLFCQQSKGIPRAQMPQLSGNPVPGSPADTLERNQRGRVDIAPQFIDALEKGGVGITEETVPASSLKATQSELNGTAVAGMMQAIRGGTLKDAPIFVTRDNYVIDGHHRWAAQVGVDTEDNALGDVQMPVRRLDMEIGEALDFASAFSAEQGIAPVKHGQAAIPSGDKPRVNLPPARGQAFRDGVAAAAGEPRSTTGGGGDLAAGPQGPWYDTAPIESMSEADVNDALDLTQDPARRDALGARLNEFGLATAQANEAGDPMTSGPLERALNAAGNSDDAKAVHEATDQYKRSSDGPSRQAATESLGTVLDRIENGDDPASADLARTLRAGMTGDGSTGTPPTKPRDPGAPPTTPAPPAPIGSGSGVTVGDNMSTLVDSMGVLSLSGDDNTTLPHDLADAASEYDDALGSDDLVRRAHAHLNLAKQLTAANDLLDNGDTEPERMKALRDLAAVNAVVDANVDAIFPPADAGGTPPSLDAPTIDQGTVNDMLGSAGRPELEGTGGSGAKYLVKGTDGQWRFTAERQALHDAIVADIIDGVAPSDDPTYNFFGGGPASGKGGITRMFPQLKEGAAYINADEIKAVIPEMGKRVRGRDPSAAGFTHEESSYLAKVAQAKGFGRKINVTLDGTGDSAAAKVKKKIEAARKAGYKVDAYYVSVPVEVAAQRAIDRAKNGVGADRGRAVPESVIRHTHASVSAVFPQVMESFDTVQLFDTNVPWGQAPNLVVRKVSPDVKAEIISEGKWQEFLDKAAGVAGAGGQT